MSPSNYVPFIHLFTRASLSHSISVSFCLSPEVEVGAATWVAVKLHVATTISSHGCQKVVFFYASHLPNGRKGTRGIVVKNQELQNKELILKKNYSYFSVKLWGENCVTHFYNPGRTNHDKNLKEKSNSHLSVWSSMWNFVNKAVILAVVFILQRNSLVLSALSVNNVYCVRLEDHKMCKRCLHFNHWL